MSRKRCFGNPLDSSMGSSQGLGGLAETPW